MLCCDVGGTLSKDGLCWGWEGLWCLMITGFGGGAGKCGEA